MFIYNQILSLFFLIFLITSSYALKPDRIFVFGDSLSDAGYQDELPTDISFEAREEGSRYTWPVNKHATFTSPPFDAGEGPQWVEPGKVWSQYLAQLYPQSSLTQTTNNKFVVKQDPNDPSNKLYNFAVSGTKGGYDFAAGGATTSGEGIDIIIHKKGVSTVLYSPPSLFKQISNFKKQRNFFPLSNNDVVVIWAGANDLLKLLEYHKNGVLRCPPVILQPSKGCVASQAYGNDSDFIAYGSYVIKHAIDDIGTAVKELHASGFKNFVFLTLPSLQHTPLAQTNPFRNIKNFNYDLNLAAYTYLSYMNIKIPQVISGLKDPQVRYKIIDTYTLLNKIVAQKYIALPETGQVISFKHVTHKACRSLSSDGIKALKGLALFQSMAISCNPFVDSNFNPLPKDQYPVGYVFEDEVHPTSRVHKVIAYYVKQAIDEM